MTIAPRTKNTFLYNVFIKIPPLFIPFFFLFHLVSYSFCLYILIMVPQRSLYNYLFAAYSAALIHT